MTGLIHHGADKRRVGIFRMIGDSQPPARLKASDDFITGGLTDRIITERRDTNPLHVLGQHVTGPHGLTAGEFKIGQSPVLRLGV